jgi:ABC-2 type transport system ATP-binding protein
MQVASPDSQREVILEARELTREFDGVKALDRLSLKLHRGEVLGLLGANGAGKTTAMNCLLGLTLPTSGGLFAFGMPLHQHRVEILGRANFSSAYTSLPGNLRVWQNLITFARIYRVPNARARIAELLDLLEVSHLRNRVTGQLSAGESTRVNLCKALLNKPELLMLDNMKDIEEVCDRVIFLHKGRIIAEGTPEEIVHRFEEQSLEHVFIKIARSGELEDEPS